MRLSAIEALEMANRIVLTLSMADQDGVPWCQYPLLTATGWFGNYVNEVGPNRDWASLGG